MARSYVPVELRRQIRMDAGARCGYCHSPEAFIGMPHDIEHIYPEALGGPTIRENLWLACTRCNDFKGDRVESVDLEGGQHVPLFNPRTHVWTEHFAWSLDGVRIVGLTSIGRATVEALRLNNEFIVLARRFWVEAGRWPPPEDVR
jgi:HNH endonuclease